MSSLKETILTDSFKMFQMLNSSLLNGVTGIVAPMAATASMFHKSRGEK